MLPDFDEEWAGPSGWAAMYRACGLQVVPAVSPAEDPVNYKRPKLAWAEFQNELTSDAVFDRWYGPFGEARARANMGLLTGSASSGVFCVDLDEKPGSQAASWWAGLLAVHANDMEPETVAQRTGGGGRQVLFRAPPGYVPPTFKTPIGIDIRGRGGFMMCPPSMHVSGRAYAWEDGRGPHELEIGIAPEWLIDAIAELQLQHGGSLGSSRERADYHGTTKDAFGADVDGREGKLASWIWGAVVGLYREAPMPPGQARQEEAKADLWDRYLRSTKPRIAPRHGEDRATTLDREGRGRAELERKWRQAMKKWFGRVAEDAANPPKDRVDEGAREAAAEYTATVADSDEAIFDPWERYLVPKFPLEALPPILKRFVEFQAQSIGVDPGAVAMAALASCGGALHQGISLKMRRTGDWFAHPRLWVMLVGDPSAKKTPAISACVKPLRTQEGVLRDAYAKDVARFQELKEAGEKPAAPEKPVRYISNDTSVETIGEILTRQDRGILAVKDELSGWIGSMERYSGGKGASSDRAFWLEAFNGGPYSIDRIGRGEKYVRNLAVGLVGGIQPQKLAELKDTSSDGLWQRFLPVMMTSASLGDEVDDEGPKDDFGALIDTLLKVPDASLRMSEGAQRINRELEVFLHEIIGMEALGANFCAWLGKVANAHGAISLILHMCNRPSDGLYVQFVDEATARAADTIIRKYVIPHALAFYQQTLDHADWEGLRAAASFILTTDKDRLVGSDFATNVRSLRGLGVWDLNQRLSPLVAGGWLLDSADATPSKAVWTVAPGVRAAMAERREKEILRKKVVKERFDAIRSSVDAS